MLGERGGTTGSLQEAEALQEQHKSAVKNRVRQRIEDVLCETGHFHSEDLISLDLDPDDKNIIGSQIGAFSRAGWMVETGVRRASSSVSRRKSSVYRITVKGREAFQDRVEARKEHREAWSRGEQDVLFEIEQPKQRSIGHLDPDQR